MRSLFISLVIRDGCLIRIVERIGEKLLSVILIFLSWLGFGKAFAIYISNFSSNYVATYAGLASIMIIIGFLYTLAVLFIYFSEINETLFQTRRELDINQ